MKLQNSSLTGSILKLLSLEFKITLLDQRTSKWYGLKTTGELAERPKPSNVSRNTRVSSATTTYRK